MLRNCILWQNTNEILNEGVATTTLTYSLINGASAPAGTTADNSLFNTNPNFVNAAGGNLRLQDCSPAINSGTSTGAPATDLDNNPRPALGSFDMGAYESQSSGGGSTTYYRDMDGDGFGDPLNTTIACTQPTGYVANNTDCNDNNNLIKPGATELCDGVDNDCDGMTDEGLTLPTWYRDMDADGFGNPAMTQQACTQPTGYVANNTDCNDNNNLIKPGATELCDGVDNDCDGMTDEGLTLPTWYRDMDADGFGNPAMTQQACTQPTGYVANNTDCNDNNNLIKPGATELCDGVDNDCDGMTDEGLTLPTWYRDMDADGFGNPAMTQQACTQPTGYVANNTDCNDNNNLIKPGATELCDGVDNDCDGMTDEGLTLPTWYRDMDADGFGNPAMTQQACTQPTGYVANNTDCNDNNNLIKPGATELCDGVDNDCDGMTDEGLTLPTWYRDMDADGFGNPAITQQACTQPTGYVANNTDCNDNNNLIKPGATELCDGVDNDCDGMTDEGVQTTYYRDMDGDTFGDPANTTLACSPPTGYVTNNTDCDDNDALEKPGQVWYDDTDNDGHGQTGAASITACLRPTGYKAAVELMSTAGDCNDNNAAIKPGATEICDSIDNDCDGMTDEGVQTTYYRDMDGDTFGDPANTTLACSPPTGYVTNNTDCDDNDALEKPGQVWYDDTDNDGHGQTGAASITACLRPTGYKAAVELMSTAGDCNDAVAAINPAATEICDGIDNNCDGQIDNGALATYYQDSDGDGFGNAAMTQQACSQPTGYVANNTDCDDNDALEFPGQVWYDDTDNDGHGQTGAASITACLRPTGYKAAVELMSTAGDCNDNNFNIKPGATEICDSIDNDCDGMTDEGVQTTYYRDMDGDTFGDPANTTLACSQPTGFVTNNTDCDDTDALEKPGQVWYDDTDNDGHGQTGATSITACLRPTGYKAAVELMSTAGDCNDDNAAIKPGATEICDSIDNNCDGSTDEGVQTTYYRDMDGDGFGNPSNTTMACSQPTGYVPNNTDCDDNDALEFPGQVWYDDTDNDGHGQTGAASITACLRPTGYKAAVELMSTAGDCNDAVAAINPAATEICDGIDNNCDGPPTKAHKPLTTGIWMAMVLEILPIPRYLVHYQLVMLPTIPTATTMMHSNSPARSGTMIPTTTATAKRAQLRSPLVCDQLVTRQQLN